MHIHIVPNRNSKPAVLLRESYREGKKVRKRTIANLSKLPVDQIDSLRRILKGEKLVSPDELFDIVLIDQFFVGHRNPFLFGRPECIVSPAMQGYGLLLYVREFAEEDFSQIRLSKHPIDFL